EHHESGLAADTWLSREGDRILALSSERAPWVSVPGCRARRKRRRAARNADPEGRAGGTGCQSMLKLAAERQHLAGLGLSRRRRRCGADLLQLPHPERVVEGVLRPVVAAGRLADAERLAVGLDAEGVAGLERWPLRQPVVVEDVQELRRGVVREVAGDRRVGQAEVVHAAGEEAGGVVGEGG